MINKCCWEIHTSLAVHFLLHHIYLLLGKCHEQHLLPFYTLSHVSMLLTTVLLMYIYTACWLNNYVVQLCPFWCNSYGARLSRLLTSHCLSLLSGFHLSCLKVSIIPQAGENGNLFEWNSRCDYHSHHVQDSPMQRPCFIISSFSTFGCY